MTAPTAVAPQCAWDRTEPLARRLYQLAWPGRLALLDALATNGPGVLARVALEAGMPGSTAAGHAMGLGRMGLIAIDSTEGSNLSARCEITEAGRNTLYLIRRIGDQVR